MPGDDRAQRVHDYISGYRGGRPEGLSLAVMFFKNEHGGFDPLSQWVEVSDVAEAVTLWSWMKRTGSNDCLAVLAAPSHGKDVSFLPLFDAAADLGGALYILGKDRIRPL